MSDLFFTAPDDDDLQPITAGVAGRLWGWWKNYTSAERRANAALQLRDRFGRFAEMGRDHKFKFRDRSGATRNGTGIYVGPASREGYGRFYVKNDPILGTGIVEVSNKNFREVLTSLSEDYLRSRGIKLGEDTRGNIVGARKDTDIPNIDDLNIQPATDEDIAAATSKVEDMPDLEEVIKDADSGSIKYGDLKAGVIVRDEAGNRLGIITQVDFVDGKVKPIIRWQDGERTPGVESDPEDSLTVWVPAEDADSAEGNKEKASVKARLQLMAFKDGGEITAKDLKKGDSVVVDGQTLTVKSKKNAPGTEGSFKIEFADENGDVIISDVYDSKDKFATPKAEKPKAEVKKVRTTVTTFAADLKRGDVVLVGAEPGREAYVVSVATNKGADPTKTTYDVTVELADTNEVVTLRGIPKGTPIGHRIDANGKKVNRKADMKSAAPAKPEAEPKPAPSAEQPSAEESAPTQKQLDSINRRLNEGRYPGIVSEARAKEINDLMPTLTKGNVGKIIKELNDAELNWRMDHGWSVDELIGKYYTNKDGSVVLPSKELSQKYRSYKPTKDENGEPLPGVEQPAEGEQQETVEETPAQPLPESGEIGASGYLTNKLKYEIDQDGNIRLFDDWAVKTEDGTYVYKDLFSTVAYSKDAKGTAKRTQEKKPNGKFSHWQISIEIPRNHKDSFSPEEFRKEILQRIYNRIHGIHDPNDVSDLDVTIPDEPVSEEASGDISGTPGDSGSLGNGVGYSIDARSNIVIHGDVDQGTPNGDAIDRVLWGTHNGYSLVVEVDESTGALVISLNSDDKNVPISQHAKTLLNAIKESLSTSEPEPAPEPEAEPRRLANGELADPTRGGRTGEAGNGQLGPDSMQVEFSRYQDRTLGIFVKRGSDLPQPEFDPNNIQQAANWVKYQDLVIRQAIRKAISLALSLSKEDTPSFVLGKAGHQLEMNADLTPSEWKSLLDNISDAIADAVDNMPAEIQKWVNRDNEKKAAEEAAKKKKDAADAAEKASWEELHGSVLSPSQRSSFLGQLKDAVANGIITKERETEIKNQMRDGKFGTKDLELVQAELSGEKPAEESTEEDATSPKPDFIENPADETPESNNGAYWNWVKDGIKNKTISESDLDEAITRAVSNSLIKRSFLKVLGEKDGKPVFNNLLKSLVQSAVTKATTDNPDASRDDVLKEAISAFYDQFRDEQFGVKKLFGVAGEISEENGQRYQKVKAALGNAEEYLNGEVEKYVDEFYTPAEPTPEPEPEPEVEETPTAEPEPEAEPTPTPTPEPEPEEEEDDEEELTPDRELQTVKATEIVVGDLVWDSIRGFGRVVSQPKQDDKDPNVLLIEITRPGDSTPRRLRIRKGASISIAKREGAAEPTPTPTPTPTKPEPTPKKPEPTPAPKPEPKPQPTPSPAPKPKSQPKTKVGTTRVYYMDPRGTGRPSPFNFVSWSDPAEKDRLIARFKEMEAIRKAEYDLEESFGRAKEPYKPMFLFEDGFEFSAEAATKKQLSSIARRLAIPGLMSADEIKQIAADLPSMSKAKIFDLINKLDILELNWRIDNGYPVNDLLEHRVPKGFDRSKLDGYLPTKNLSDLPPAYIENMPAKPAAMSFLRSKNIGTDLGVILNPTTMDAAARQPAPGAFTGSLLDAVQGKNWAEVLDFMKNLETPIFYFDTETTGISDYDGDNQPNNALQVGIIKVVKGEVTDRFNIYLNPDAPLGEWSSKNLKRDVVSPTGERIGDELVTDEWLSQQMSTEEAVRQMIEFMGNNPLIGGQNVPFDLEVLQRMLDKAGVTDFSVAGTVDSKDLIDAIIPKYDPENGVDGPKKETEKGSGKYVSTTSLGYVAKFLGFDTTRWHSADADAEDAYRLVMRSLEIGSKNPNEKLWAIDKKFMAKRYSEEMTKFLSAISPESPATEKQRGVDKDNKGFRSYLQKAGFNEDEQGRVLAPIDGMTRGQAAEYISSFIKSYEGRSDDYRSSKLSLQRFINGAESNASENISNVISGVDVSEVTGLRKKILINSIRRNKKAAVDATYLRQKFLASVVGGYKKLDEIYGNPTEENLAKLQEAEELFEDYMKDRASLENVVALKVGKHSYITYDKNDGVEITPTHLEKLSKMLTKAREIAPIGNRKLRVSLVNNEEMLLLFQDLPEFDDTSAFFTFDGSTLNIVMRKEAFYESRMDPRFAQERSGRIMLHNRGHVPAFVLDFLHEYGHAYHRAVFGTTMRENEVFALAKDFKERFEDTFISSYGKTSHSEKFAELFFDFLYSRMANRAPANQEFTDYMDMLISEKNVQPVNAFDLVGELIVEKREGSKPAFMRMPNATVRNVSVDGVVELTGETLRDLERSMEGYSRGNWLAGTDAESGLVPSVVDADGNFNEEYFMNKFIKPKYDFNQEAIDNISPEKMAQYRNLFISAAKKAASDQSKYRVFQIDGTNQFIRVKDAVATPEMLSDIVKNARTLTALNNLGNVPTYYTILPNGSFTYDVLISNDEIGQIAGIAETAGEHGVFFGLFADAYGVSKAKVDGLNAILGGPDAKDRFNRTQIHEYGHGIASLYMGTESMPLYREFEEKFGNKPMSNYGATSVRENFAEYFYAMFMWITEKGVIPPHLREFANFYNEKIAGKNPIGVRPREVVSVPVVEADKPNFPEIKEDADALAEYNARRSFYENGLTPMGTKLDQYDSTYIRSVYNRVLAAENAYLSARNNPNVSESAKELAKTTFHAQVGALKTAYDTMVMSGGDKYGISSNFQDPKFQFMGFSDSWKDDEQGYPVIWDGYYDMPRTYADPVDKDVFTAEERSALKNYGYSGWRWISNLLEGKEMSRTVADMTESMLRGLTSAFAKPEARLDRNMYLYHGSTGNPGDAQHDALIDAMPGDEITLPSFSSTSMSPVVAYDDFGPGSASLLNPEEGFFLIIRAPKGSNAIVMPQGLTYKDGEREVLLNAGAKLRVLEVSRSPRLDSEGYEIPNAYSTYIEADLISTESIPDREFETPAGVTRAANFEQDLDYLTASYADSFNNGLDIFTDPDGGLGSSNSVVGYVKPSALSGMPGNTDIDNGKVEKMVRSMELGSLPTKPVVISYNPQNKTAYVLDGNHRVAAALKANVPFLPTIVVTNYVANSNSKKLDKGWAIPPFGFDTEEATSERWPDSFHPYFIFSNDDMLTPATGNGRPMFMQFEPSVWSSKVEPESMPERFRPEEGPSEETSQYGLEQVHPGAYVMNKKTGKIGVVYGEMLNPGEPTSAGVIVKYLNGSEDSYPTGFFVDEEFDEKGIRRVESGLASASGYSDIRYYTLRVTNPADLENVTESFITPGTDGILVGDTMFGVIKGTDKRGKIVGFPAKGALTIAIQGNDGEFSFENIPLSDFLPIQKQRYPVIPGETALHSVDMLPTKDDLDLIFIKATNLYNWGYLSEPVYRALIESVRGKFLTKSGTKDLAQYLIKFDELRARKIDGKKAGKMAPSRKRSSASIQPTPTQQQRPIPENVGNMTVDQFLDYMRDQRTPGSAFMQFPDGQQNTSPSIETRVTVNPPAASDLRTVQNIIQEPGVISDQDAQNYWSMLPNMDAELLGVLKNRLLSALLNKRLSNEEPVDGIEIPENFDRSKLDGYLPKFNLDGSPYQVPTTRDKAEREPLEGELSAEQKWLYNHLESTKSPVFITGKAGTGKSFLLKFFRDFTEKNVAVTAFTGTAAENVGGTTIHSLFGLKPGAIYGETPASQLITGSAKKKAKIRATLEALDTLVVDEISMVSADLLDAMDRVLRNVKGKPFVPFGGVQFVGFGDVFQLSPFVGKRDVQLKDYMEKNYRSMFFFDARAWVDQPLEVYELSQVFRQSDPEFKQVLNNIRVGRFTQDDLEFINEAGMRPVASSVDDLIYAVTTNDLANQINQEEMDKLGNVKSMTYTGEFNGSGKEAFDMLPAPEQLFLKVGAQVMFTRNDTPSSSKDSVDQESGQGQTTSRRWVNGTVGTVVALEEDHVKVRVGDNVYDVYPTLWDKIGYDAKPQVDSISNQVTNKLSPFTEATYEQIPLMLAWAATIHKLQGKTINNLKVDLGDGAFATGQLYTALSRVKSLNGLYLERPVRMTDVKVDGNAKRFADAMYPAESPDEAAPMLMRFGGEPFDPADPDLDLDKELGYDFRLGRYGTELTDYQKGYMDWYANAIAEAEEQFGSNSNRVKHLKSMRREQYDSWFARPEMREDNITESSLGNLDIDYANAETTTNETPTVVESETVTTASYKDRYGREYEMEATVRLTESQYDPYELEPYVQVYVYDKANPSGEPIARFDTQFGGPMEGDLANKLYVGYVQTNEAYRRRHIATGMLAFARELVDQPIYHSDKLTKMGHAFMESVDLDDRLKTVKVPTISDEGAQGDAPVTVNMAKLSETKTSAEITDYLQRLNAANIQYKIEY